MIKNNSPTPQEDPHRQDSGGSGDELIDRASSAPATGGDDAWVGVSPQESGGLVDATIGTGLNESLSAQTVDGATKEQTAIVDLTASPNSESIAAIAINSPPVWGGSGAAVICLGTSLTGAIGHTLVTIWSLRNEVRERNRDESHREIEASANTPTRGGLLGLGKDLVNSPGLNLAVGLAAYAFTAGAAASQGFLPETIAFSSFVIGHSAALRLANSEYTGDRIRDSLLERWAVAAWDKLAHPIQKLLRDPGPGYALGNIVLGINATDLATVAQHPYANSLTALGLILATVGIARSAWSVFTETDQDRKPSGLPSYLNGASNVAIGVAALSQGGIILGVANLMWGVSNWLWGRRIDGQR